MKSVFDTARTTRSIRQFRDSALAEEEITQILEAGRLSGSAKNVQPWHFVAVQDRATLWKLSECGGFAGHLAGAALGVALVTLDPFLRITVPFDLGRASQNMMLTAWSLGIGSVMATIYKADKARTILEIPPEFVVPWCISFGYPAEPQERPARKGGRRPADDVIHRERW
jgi:nitroreductase